MTARISPQTATAVFGLRRDDTPRTISQCYDKLEMLRSVYGITAGPEVEDIWGQIDFLSDNPEHYL